MMAPTKVNFHTAALLLAFLAADAASTEYPVLYTQQINNNDDIVLLRPGGVNKTITDHPRKDSSPVVSPDGRYILFTSERVGWWKIWKMDLADGSFTQLTDSRSAEYAPSWSPSGDQIAFVSSRDGNAEIYIMNSDGSELRNLSNTGSDDTTPHWHNERIYFSSEVDGALQVVSVASDGTDREVHTSGSSDKLMPQISPDGSLLLYYSEVNGNTDIYVSNLSGGAAKRLTTDPLLDMRARWSPDGRQIVFERGDKQRNQHIFLMDADGDNVHRVTSSGYNYAASFVADCSFLCAGQ